MRVVTSYCLVRVIKIAEILDKTAAPWPCDCFIQQQGVLGTLLIPYEPKAGRRVCHELGGSRNYESV
jgi:hypothetical protein